MNTRNLASLVSAAASWWPDRIYLDGERCQYSYRQAWHTTATIACQLRADGVTAGDRVVVVTHNCPEVVLYLFALNSIGAIAVILHESVSAENFHHIVAEVEPVVVVHDATTWPLCETLQCRTLDVAATPRSTHAAVMTSNAGEWFVPPHGHPAFIVYTSGSTGRPRGVILSHDNVLFVVDKINRRLGYQGSDCIGLYLPLAFDYGLYQAFLVAISGATLYLRDARYAGPALLSSLTAGGVTVLPGMPNMYESLIRIAQRRNAVLPDIRLMTNTGAHLSQAFISQLQQIMPNAGICPMYGLTECKRVSIMEPDELQRKPGSVGRPLDETSVLIVDENGFPVAPGVEGELVIRGAHVAQGYWKAPQETEKRFRRDPVTGELQLFSGDGFVQDQDGFLYYRRRLDQQIKHKGFRINPIEIEEQALRCSGVVNASVVQVEGRLVLFIVTDDPQLDPQDVLHWLVTQIELYKVPDLAEVIDAMPLTRNGKIDQAQLRERLIHA